jgi:hypothetical protein
MTRFTKSNPPMHIRMINGMPLRETSPTRLYLAVSGMVSAFAPANSSISRSATSMVRGRSFASSSD